MSWGENIENLILERESYSIQNINLQGYMEGVVQGTGPKLSREKLREHLE